MCYVIRPRQGIDTVKCVGAVWCVKETETVWMRFVGGEERTPFAVAAGGDRTDPRIGSVRVREGRASRGNPPPYLLKVSGTDTGLSLIHISEPTRPY